MRMTPPPTLQKIGRSARSRLRCAAFNTTWLLHALKLARRGCGTRSAAAEGAAAVVRFVSRKKRHGALGRWPSQGSRGTRVSHHEKGVEVEVSYQVLAATSSMPAGRNG